MAVKAPADRVEFLPYMLGAHDAGGRREQPRAALQRHTAALVRHHRQDRVIGTCEDGR
jgi:hypothetical protein